MKVSNVFGSVSGASFIGMDTKTVPVLTGGKSNPMQGRVTKIMKGASVMVFQNKKTNGYENMVKRRLEAEGKDPESFVLGERAWGTRVPNTPIVEYKGKRYVEVIFLKPGSVSYELDGQPIDSSKIIGFKKEEGFQGGLSNKVIVRSFAEESITQLRIDGNIIM